MDGIRISKGIARYTNTFNPSAESLLSVEVSPPGGLGFSAVPTNASFSLPLDVRNTNAAPVTVGLSAVPPFFVSTNTVALATGEARQVLVTFAPTAVGIFSNVLSLSGVANPTAIPLRGEGVPDLTDSDGDGIPDYWELAYGLSTNNPLDAAMIPAGDCLTYFLKYRYGLNPQTPDTDGDGLRDCDELFVLGSNALSRDGDEDGMPDDWEVAHGLNPRLADANEDTDLDGLSNGQEYAWGLAHTNRPLDPSRAFSLGGAAGDYQVATGNITNRFYYDKNDRLIGADYANGLSIAYVYDGNNNPVRQIHSSRRTQSILLPVSWLARYGLADSGAANDRFDDPDGDGWSNVQEWRAGSNPTNALSMPANFTAQTAPLACILPEPHRGAALARIDVRIWDNEGNPALAFLQYSNAATTNWSDATITHIDNVAYAAVSAMPTGTTHHVTWNAGQDVGTGWSNTVWLRVRARDENLDTNFGSWSAAVPYQLVIEVDTDADGLPDPWEQRWFGSLQEGPDGDFDRDGFSNYREYGAGTDPTDPNSLMRITSVALVPSGIRVDWQGGANGVQYLQRAGGLEAGDWQNILTNPSPVPITGSYTDMLGTNAMWFYRIKVEP